MLLLPAHSVYIMMEAWTTCTIKYYLTPEKRLAILTTRQIIIHMEG